jgi:hypothetical protein
MSKTAAVVFLFDVDNTLLDNDLVQSHLKGQLADAYGASKRRLWSGVTARSIGCAGRALIRPRALLRSLGQPIMAAG